MGSSSSTPQSPEPAVAVAPPPQQQPLRNTPLSVLADVQDMTGYLLTFLGAKDQRSLLNTSRQLADMKKYLLYWKLTDNHSLRFYENASFRAQLEALRPLPTIGAKIR
jgi:hypothetical protein